MNARKIFTLVVGIVLATVLSGCSGLLAQPTPTNTPTATVTATTTNTPTFVPTEAPTQTPLPTETPIPLPVSLLGTVNLSGDSVKPFASQIQLREADSFALFFSIETDSQGVYAIEGVEPGAYELWVLITTKSSMLADCSDVRPQDESWKLGIEFEGDKALTMENAHLSKGLLLAEGLQGSDLNPIAYYFVLSGFEVKPGSDNTFDVILFCD